MNDLTEVRHGHCNVALTAEGLRNEEDEHGAPALASYDKLNLSEESKLINT